MGVFLALCGVCACALMQVLLLPIGRGFTGQCLDIGACDLASAIGGRVPEAVVTFEPREEALGAWQEVKGEAMSVNEALYLWGVDSVKSTVTVLEEGDFTEEGGGFDWRGCFSVGGYHFLWRRGAF